MTPTAINRQPMLVAVGASAGGLEALTQLLRAAPEGTGMTFVVVQHLSPDYKSMMVELLDRRTTLTVKKAEDGLVPEAEHAYVIEPQTTIRLDGDVLRIEATERKERVPQPINFFFESMAANREGGCVGIVLSGTGSDGARGCEAIKDAGGTVIVQDPGSAAFDGMPSAAIRTGSADLVLAPELMIQEMMSLHEAGPATYFGLSGEHGSTVLAQLIATLRKQVGVNFTHYKPTTVIRRIQRRMQHLGFEDPRAYGERLRGDEAECAALYHDLLI
ncbi:MAG: chemotaxis protein CheB, partial [Myxococcota bacterium]